MVTFCDILHEAKTRNQNKLSRVRSTDWKSTLKLKLRVFLAGRSVAMVTYYVTKIIPTCSPVIGQCFDTMIVASIDKELVTMTHQNLGL